MKSTNGTTGIMHYVGVGWTLMLLAVVVFWLSYTGLMGPGAWQWYVLTVFLVALAVFSFVKDRKLRKRVGFCIPCNKNVQSQSGLCPNCGAKVVDQQSTSGKDR